MRKQLPEKISLIFLFDPEQPEPYQVYVNQKRLRPEKPRGVLLEVEQFGWAAPGDPLKLTSYEICREVYPEWIALYAHALVYGLYLKSHYTDLQGPFTWNLTEINKSLTTLYEFYQIELVYSYSVDGEYKQGRLERMSVDCLPVFTGGETTMQAVDQTAELQRSALQYAQCCVLPFRPEIRSMCIQRINLLGEVVVR